MIKQHVAFISFFMTLCFGIVAAAFVSPAAAAEGTSIATVDVQQMLTESDASQSIQKQLKERREKYTKDLRKQEESLRKEEKELVEQKEKLSKDDFAKKRKAFEEKLFEVRKMTQERKRSLEKATAEAMKVLRTELFKVVQSIADERNINLVISRQNVVVGEKSLDITEEAMKRLNKELKTVKLDVKDK